MEVFLKVLRAFKPYNDIGFSVFKALKLKWAADPPRDPFWSLKIDSIPRTSIEEPGCPPDARKKGTENGTKNSPPKYR